MLVKGKVAFIVVLFLFRLCYISLAGGIVAFDYSIPDKDDLKFLSSFDVVITGEIWKKSVVESLKKKGVKLIFYDWLPADYFCKNSIDGWHEAILKHLSRWVIDSSPEDPDPMGGRYGCKDYFFSFTDDFIKARVNHIISVLKKTAYNGVFFDWASGFRTFKGDKNFNFLGEEYKKKFGNRDYDLQVLKFLKVLKSRGVLIALNRGFRSKNAMFDRYADFDVAESVFTTVETNICRSIFIKDYGLGRVCETEIEKPDTAIRFGEHFVEEAKKANPKIIFVFLNYALPYYVKTNNTVYFKGREFHIYEPEPDRQALLFGRAVACLVGGVNFACDRNVGLRFVKDKLYSVNLGKPLGKYRVVGCKKGKVYVRFFEKGFSVVGKSGCLVSFKAFGHIMAYDMLDRKLIKSKGGVFVIKLHSQTYFGSTVQPVGDIFLYR